MSFDKITALKAAEKYVQVGQFIAAIDEYRKIIEADPKALSVMNTLGDLYVRIGHNAEAIEIFSRIAEDYCQNDFPHKAIAMYKKLLKLEPGNYEISLKLGDLYVKQAWPVDARQQYRIVISAFKRKGQMKNALEVMKKIALLDPANIDERRRLAEAYKASGFQNEAYEVYSKLGQDFFAKNKLAEAIEGFEKALAIMPGSYAALKSLVDIYTQENRADKAIDLLKDQLASNPREIEILKLLGRAYLNAGMIDKAEKTFHRLWELDATCHYYFMAICRHCLKQGEPARAIAIIDRNSNLLIAHKQESEAISMLKEIAQEQTNRIAALKSIANIHALKCEKEKLLATLNDIVETAVNLAMREEAISALNRLIELKPQDRSYKLRLADLSGAQPHSLTTDAYVINFEAPIIEDSDETVHQEFELTDLFAPNLALQQEEFVELEPLTGGLPTMLLPDDSIEISSRRFFDEFLNREWRRAAREDKSLSLIIIEIDYFKAYMECYGQPRVDASLRQIARSLNNELKRPTDLLSHYSSRKFAFILPGTHAEGAFMVAERMRARIESLNIAHEHSEISKRVTISLGAAAITPPRKSAPKTLIDAAKQALTRAQRNGGNRTIIASIFGNSVSFTLDDDQSKSKNTSDANYDEDTDEMNMPIEHHFQPVSSSIPSSFFKR